jgi:hypothetical protein
VQIDRLKERGPLGEFVEGADRRMLVRAVRDVGRARGHWDRVVALRRLAAVAGSWAEVIAMTPGQAAKDEPREPREPRDLVVR